MTTEWDGIARWLDGQHGDTGDLWHRALIDPPVLALIGDVQGLDVIDVACGNGYLTRKLARQGARLTAVDASSASLELAQARDASEPLGIIYHVRDAAWLDGIEAGRFDLAVCNMALMDIADAAGAIREISRVLKPAGRFVASLSHPCFQTVGGSAWLIEQSDDATTVSRRVSRYRQVTQGPEPWRTPNGLHTTTSYHRPLAWYFRAFKAAGFAVTAFEEPEPTAEFFVQEPQAAWIAEIPVDCVIEAIKL